MSVWTCLCNFMGCCVSNF